MFDLVDFSKRKSINHSKSHGRGRKAENEIWLKNKYDKFLLKLFIVSAVFQTHSTTWITDHWQSALFE